MKVIPNFSNYLISKCGFVERLDGFIPSVHTTQKGYKATNLKSDNGIWKTVKIHSLVLCTYVGPRPENQQALHDDGDKENNCLDNLYWGTALENSDDKFRLGEAAVGGRIGLSKLTEADIPEIRRLDKVVKMSRRKIAKKYGVSHTVINGICNRKHWKHV